eukprot:COSAG01_NODE_3361_length_6199_cov_4.450492_11_plen_52_part_00
MAAEEEAGGEQNQKEPGQAAAVIDEAVRRSVSQEASNALLGLSDYDLAAAD